MKLERAIAFDISQLVRTEQTCTRLWLEAYDNAEKEEKAGNRIKEFEYRKDASMWKCESLICQIELAEEYGIHLSIDGLEALKEKLEKFTRNQENLHRTLEIMQEEAA